MLAKLTSKNQLTLPKRTLDALGSQPVPTYFEVDVEDGRIVLTPANLNTADTVRPDTVRRKLADLGITDADVADAVAWARQRS